MLSCLRIRDLAIIDELELELGSGLNVLTGETGSGKSILVSALELVLGGKSRGELVRTGAKAAEVEALFEARDAWERNYVLTALAAFDGNISRTADALGLERSNLYKKMRALGIAPSRERDEATEQ